MRHPAITVIAVSGSIALGLALAPAPARAAPEQVIHMTARKFEYQPSEITVKKNVPVVLEIQSIDRDHGFKLPQFGVRADIKPGQITRVRFVPKKVGHFLFSCDVFCGSGHEDMSGELVVVE